MGNRASRRKLLVPALLLLAIAAALWAILGQRPSATSELDLVGFVDGDVLRLAAKVAGRIDKVPVQDGSTVATGDVVASLERDEFQLRVDRADSSLATARARVVEAEKMLAHDATVSDAEIARARATVEMERAQARQVAENADLAKKEYDRAAELLKTSAGTQQEFDRRSADWRSAQSAQNEEAARLQEREFGLNVAEATREEVEMRRAEVETAKRLVREAEVAVEQARLDLRQSVTLAPVAGTVLLRQALPGEIVQVGSPIASLVDLDRLWIAVDLEESFVGRLALGDAVEVRLPSDPAHPRTGKVSLIAEQADFATQRDIGRNKVDVKTFRVRIAVDNSDRTFKLGMTVRARFSLREPGAGAR